MKAIERILMKAAIIQFLILLLSQLFLHQFDAFVQTKRLAKYEGVTKNTAVRTVETMKEK